MSDAEIVFYKSDDINVLQELAGNLPGLTINTIKNVFVRTVQFPKTASTIIQDGIGIRDKRINSILFLIMILIQLVIFPIIYCISILIAMFILLKCIGPALKQYSFFRFLTFMIVAALNGPYLIYDYYSGKIPCN